jgi:hypothetical protein
MEVPTSFGSTIRTHGALLRDSISTVVPAMANLEEDAKLHETLKGPESLKSS